MDVVDDDKMGEETLEVVDDRHFPLVWSMFPQRATLPFVERYFLKLRQQAERGPFVLICDIRTLNVSTATAPVRAAFFKASEHFDREVGPSHYLGEAIIVASTLQRALLSTYTWFIADASYPTKIFRSEEDARAWCLERVADAGLAGLPPPPPRRTAARD